MSNMNLVKDLLETASTLLNESSGYNGLAKRIYEEKYGKKSKKDIEKDKERLEKLKSHSVSEESDKKIDKKMHDLRTDERNRDILNKSAQNANGRIHSEISKGGQSLDAHVNYSNNDRAEYLDDKMEEVSRKLNENRKNTSRVNQNINERAKKSTNPHDQRKHVTNESISELLIEAAMLLTEGAQADEYKKRKQEEKEKNNRSILDDPLNKRFPTTYNNKGEQQFHEPGDKAKHYYTGDIDEKTGQRLYHTDGKDIEKNKDDHKRAEKSLQIVRNERNRRHDAEDKIISDYRKLKERHGENVPGYDKLNQEFKKHKKNADNMYGDNYLHALDATNRHLRRHGKKSQNESISELLIGAAELLNETGGKYRKNITDITGTSIHQTTILQQ